MGKKISNKKCTIGAIIQARMGSSRLPGKVLKKVAGKPMLEHQILRVRNAKNVGKIVIATIRKKEDDPIVAIAKKCGVRYFRGSEKDVLDRYYRAAKKMEIDVIVRLTGDCPLIDPRVIDDTISYFLQHKKSLDYVGKPANYPEGLDTEVFSIHALQEAWRLARKSSEREHVTSYFKNHPEKFRSVEWRKGRMDFSHFHWSVDEARDLTFVRAVYSHLYEKNKMFFVEDILALIAKYPELAEINKGLTGYEGYQKSLQEDYDFF